MVKREGNTPLGGTVAPGFEPVQEAFARHIARDTLGAACTIYHRGNVVVDLFGGWKDKARTRPWTHDTIALVYSLSKGLSAAACAVAVSRGLFSYDEPIGAVWPEFACKGKEAMTVGQVLSEQAGVAAVDLRLDQDNMADHAAMAKAMAGQVPNWTPGDYAGNHPYSLGWIACELIYRRDPDGRHLRQFFADELAGPLGVDAYLGLPTDFDRDRIARIEGFGLLDLVFKRRNMSWKLVFGLLWPWSLTFRALNNPLFLQGPAGLDEDRWWSIEDGGAGGMASAAALAAIYNAFAVGGAKFGIRGSVLDALVQGAAPPRRGIQDQVLQGPVRYSFGFEKPFPAWQFARTPAAFGTFALGGSLAFADPQDQVAYAWITNQLGTYQWDDPREKDVREAFYRCLQENCQ